MRIGIDLGGTKTEGVVINDVGNIIARERWPTPQANGYDAILDNIVALARSLSGLWNRHEKKPSLRQHPIF